MFSYMRTKFSVNKNANIMHKISVKIGLCILEVENENGKRTSGSLFHAGVTPALTRGGRAS